MHRRGGLIELRCHLERLRPNAARLLEDKERAAVEWHHCGEAAISVEHAWQILLVPHITHIDSATEAQP